MNAPLSTASPLWRYADQHPQEINKLLGAVIGGDTKATKALAKAAGVSLEDVQAAARDPRFVHRFGAEVKVTALPAPRTSAQALELAKKLIGQTNAPQLADRVARYYAATVPLPVLRLLVASGVSVRVLGSTDETSAPSKRTSDRFGATWAQLEAERQTKNPEGDGYYTAATNEVTIRWRGERRTMTTALHELMHALSAVLGTKGDERSLRNDWLDIFIAASDRPRTMPTPYAKTTADEMFCEAAAIYLGAHYDRNESGKLVVTTRQDLRRKNRAAYTYMDNLFRKELPRLALSAHKMESDYPALRAKARLDSELDARKGAAPANNKERLDLFGRFYEYGVLAKDKNALGDARRLAVDLVANGHPAGAKLLADVDAALGKV